jgi:cyanate lyase
MKKHILTKEQIRKINKSALAEKHGTSQSYVSEILYGIKSNKTQKAKAIFDDAIKLVEVFDAQTKKTA